MKNTLHINLWAGPGVGKSGVAASVFGELKKNHINCELVREAAKDLYWEDTLSKTEQFLISSKQFERESLVEGKVNVVIIDTALISGVLHCPITYKKELLYMLKILSKDWKSHHYFLERDLNSPYEINGRKQNLEESIDLDNKIKSFLLEEGIYYQSVDIKKAISTIFINIQKELEIKAD